MLSGEQQIVYLEEMVVVEEGSVVLQLPLLGLVHLALPLLLQLGHTLEETQRETSQYVGVRGRRGQRSFWWKPLGPL